MGKFNGTLSSKKFETLMKNVHIVWCSHLVYDKIFDISKTYDLSNHSKVPVKKRNETTTLEVHSFLGRFSVLSALLTPFKLKIYNRSPQHYCESMVHNDSMMDIVIPVNYFIVFHSALVHCGTPS